MTPGPGGIAPSSRRRLPLIGSLAIVVPVAFATKFYQGPGAVWVQGSLGGVLYEVFWCLALGLWLRHAPAAGIALGVLIVTCALEFLQLWQLPVLELLREGFLGRTLLGDTFSWSDFPYYLIGSGLGWVWLTQLGPRAGTPARPTPSRAGAKP
jgi:hypothetical protein